MMVCAVLLLILVSLASLMFGASTIAPSRVIAWLFGIDAGSLSTSERTILWELRLPRLITATLVGASLATAGVGFQGLFRNPLADPYIIGASSGAALGVSIVVTSGIQFLLMGYSAHAILAFAGSLLTVAIVFILGSLSNQVSTLTMLLAGIAISSMINSIVSLLMFLNDEKAVIILSWLMGSLADTDWRSLFVTAIATLMGVTLLWGMSRQLDAFLLGEEASQALGLAPYRFRMLVTIGASLATAAAVSTSGIIGFVGLIAPQISRQLIGPRHGYLIPFSAIVGAITMLIADAVARTIVAPAELPVGIVTSLLGCPFFLVLLMRRKGASHKSL